MVPRGHVNTPKISKSDKIDIYRDIRQDKQKWKRLLALNKVLFGSEYSVLDAKKRRQHFRRDECFSDGRMVPNAGWVWKRGRPAG